MCTLHLKPRLLRAQLSTAYPTSGGRQNAAHHTTSEVLSEIASGYTRAMRLKHVADLCSIGGFRMAQAHGIGLWDMYCRLLRWLLEVFSLKPLSYFRYALDNESCSQYVR
jgi:hypothetical protein